MGGSNAIGGGRHCFEGIHSPREQGGMRLGVWEQGEVLHVGAEAEVSSGSFLGVDAIRKVRRPRRWRHPDLDKRLTKQRMSAEARLLTRLHRSGLQVPAIEDIDIDTGTIIMTRMPGKPIIEHLRAGSEFSDSPATSPDNSQGNSKGDSQGDFGEDWVEGLLRDTGAIVRHLHRLGITHGDLSTNNILWHQSRGSSLIDFGLARITEEVEHFGIDLHVLHEILGASHPDHPDAMQTLLSGYSGVDEALGPPPASTGGKLPTATQVVTRLDDIRSRVRYHG